MKGYSNQRASKSWYQNQMGIISFHDPTECRLELPAPSFNKSHGLSGRANQRGLIDSDNIEFQYEPVELITHGQTHKGGLQSSGCATSQ